MRILDETADKSLSFITILLEKKELAQFIGYLKQLSLDTDQKNHYHFNNDDFSKEITIALYTKDGCLEHFADRYKKLIVTDE